MRVAIAIATCDRPQGLRRLLESLSRVHTTRIPELEVVVVVVDNGAGDRAAAVVNQLSVGFPFALRYEREERRGVTFVRGTAVQLARALGADFIAFVDDDQIVVPGWLEELVLRQRASDADVVLGAVKPIFSGPVPRWILDGGFFAFREHGDGAVIDYGRSGNVLIRLSLFDNPAIAFDHAFALSGGEDTILFDAVHQAGHRMVFSAGGLAYETIPVSRARLSWLVRRWFRTGNIDAELYLRRHRGGPRRVANLARGLLRVGFGGVAFLGAALVLGFGRGHRIVKPLYTLSRGCGIISSTFGYTYAEYREIHGG